MNLIYEKWEEILEYLRKDLDMTTVSFDTWIKPLKIHNVQDHTLRILVHMDGAEEYLEKKYKFYLMIKMSKKILQVVINMLEY